MTSQLHFENYKAINSEEIKQLFINTFSDSEGEAEGALIGNLVDNLMASTDHNEFYGFNCIKNNQLIGSIFFSKLTFENEIRAYLLSPVAVHTDFQGQGIGQQLINYGLNVLQKQNVELVITYGDPRFYTKVGFSPITEELIKAPFKLSMPEGWLGQSLTSNELHKIDGSPSCVEAFNNPDIW